MKNLNAIVLTSLIGFTLPTHASFWIDENCLTESVTINPLGLGQVSGFKYADLNWSAPEGSTTVWTVSYLGKEAGYANSFSFMSNSLFNTDVDSPGKSVETKSVNSVFSFLFGTPVGSTSSNDFQRTNTPNYFVSLSDNDMTATLWLDDTGAGNDQDYNDMGIKLSAKTTPETSPVPIPAAVWLFGSALLGMVGISRKKVKQI